MQVSQPAPGVTATLIIANTAVQGTIEATDDWKAISVIVKNVTGTAPVFLGGSNAVTTGNGFRWDVADGPLVADIEPGEALYGIVSSGTQTLHVLRGGR